MKNLFIINSTKNSKEINNIQKEIKAKFKPEDYTIVYTKYPNHAKEIVETYKAKYTDLMIYACGGDGTLHEIVNGIYPNTNIGLQIIPIGTGNDFIKSFNLNRKDMLHPYAKEQCDMISCDLILVNDEVAINTVSLGFDATITQNMQYFRFLPKGTLPYYASLLYSMASHMSDQYQFTLNQKKHEDEYTFIVFGNGKYYGGGYQPNPNAKIDDGILDYCLVKKIPRYKILQLSHTYKKGTHAKYSQYVKTGSTNQVIQFTNEKELLVNLDGELRLIKDPSIKLLTKQIQLYIPKKSLML